MSRERPARAAASIAGALVPVMGVLAATGASTVESSYFPLVLGPASGLVLLLVFAAAPWRRSGSSTVSGFIRARLDSRSAAIAVEVATATVTALLVLPLLQSAGRLIALLAGAPLAAGIGIAPQAMSTPPLAAGASFVLGLACGTAALPQVLGAICAAADGRGARIAALGGAALSGTLLAGGAVVASIAPSSNAEPLLQAGALGACLWASYVALRCCIAPVRARVLLACASIAAAAVVLALGPIDLTPLLEAAFSLAAAALFPPLVLGVWYRGLTAAGVVAGTLTAMLSTAVALLCAALLPGGALQALAAAPALLTVPLSFAVSLLASRLTRETAPADADERMLILHAPEALGVSAAGSTPGGL